MTASSAAAGRRRHASAPPASRAATTRSRPARRSVAVVYDIEKPHVRLGIAWFVLVVAGLAVGRVGVVVVYGLAAALAGAQTARAWRRARRRERPNEAVAAACAAALPVAAAASTALLGAAILGVIVVCFAVGRPAHGIRTLQAAIWPGGAAAAVVVSHRFEPWSAIALVLVVSAYEIGDYIVGSGGRYAIEGPIAGAAAVLVVGSTAGLVAFGVPDCVWMAALAAVLCPLGQIVGSLVLPRADAPASALRRLDSLLVLGPAWAWAAGQLVVR